MPNIRKKKKFCNFQTRYQFIFVLVVIVLLNIYSSSILDNTQAQRQSLNELNKKINSFNTNWISSKNETYFDGLKDFYHNRTFETTITCVGSLSNQSCLYTNLYYVNSTFTVLTLNTRNLSNTSVRTDAFHLWDTTPKIRTFSSYRELEVFVRTVINPKIIPLLTVHFGLGWHHNIGHALFDALYPAYLALIRFPPRHLLPFRILASVVPCDDCWSEDVFSRFGGLGVIKRYVLNYMSKSQWFLFDELIMGSGNLCQRCTQPNLQLPGGIELDGSRLFRDRMLRQHGLLPSIIRQKSSAEYRTSQDVLLAYIIDNKRFTDDNRKQIQDAIDEINNYTMSYMNQTIHRQTKLEWPLINVTYLYYNLVKPTNVNTTEIPTMSFDSRSPTYELIDNRFIAQLKLVQQTDIQVSGPGTSQMYQTFLPDGSVFINLGGVEPPSLVNTSQAYTSFMEQYMTSGTPYIKGIYYPINERPQGIKKDQVVQLIREAARMILEGFDIPVNPLKNLAPDGQLFVEMCEKDKEFCSRVTTRSPYAQFNCLQLWIEDFIHEQSQWRLPNVGDADRIPICPFNHTLLKQLRYKYNIKHYSDQ